MRAGFDQGRRDQVLENLEAEAVSEDLLLARSIKMLLAARQAWHYEGACRGSDIDFTSRGRNQRSAALQICGGCSVRTDCLAWAVEVDDRVAILGGYGSTCTPVHGRCPQPGHHHHRGWF
jgi:hypothetical protein